MKNNILKGVAGVVLAGASIFGGTLITDTSLQSQVTTLQDSNIQLESDNNMLIADRDAQTAQKMSSEDDYLYAMISSGRKPTLDSMPLLDLERSYIETVGTTTISDNDLYAVGVNLAKQRGDYICK